MMSAITTGNPKVVMACLLYAGRSTSSPVHSPNLFCNDAHVIVFIIHSMMESGYAQLPVGAHTAACTRGAFRCNQGTWRGARAMPPAALCVFWVLLLCLLLPSASRSLR